MDEAVDFRIRPARAEDAELLFELILELATYEKLADQVVGDAETLRRSLFEQGAAEALIVERGEEAIGYAIFFTTFSTFETRPGIWLEDIYVRPAQRRGGVGLALMRHLAGLALDRGHVRLEWCALTWNEPALQFYDGLGARRLDEWRTLRLEREDMERVANRTVSQG